MAITAAMVKELREMTGAGMMDCKKALGETNGDMDAAVEFLRKNGQAKAVKKGKKLTLTWNAVDDADGYEILVSSSKKFKKAKTVIVEGKTKTKVKKLKKDTYYVKMRAYTVDAAGNKVYGEYSDVKVVKTK